MHDIYSETYNDYLMHHGVKGMKWGVRRKRNKSSSNGNHANKQSFTQKRQAKLENEYTKKGLSKEEAYKAAQKRIKTEKILMIAGGITIAGAAAIIAKHQYDNRVDKIIKAGTKLQNMSINSNKGVADAFYASKTKLDNVKYRGIYGDELRIKKDILGIPTGEFNKVYETKMNVVKDIKVASKKNAKNILQNLIEKDPEFRKELSYQLKATQNNFNNNPLKNEILRKAANSVKSGKITNKAYDGFNVTLANHQYGNQKFIDRFYKELKNHGYDAIEDMNDKKYSGYHSKNPLIVFNGSGKAKVDSIREVGASEIKKNKGLGYADIFIKELAPIVSAYGGITGAQALSNAKAKEKIESNENNKQKNDRR